RTQESSADAAAMRMLDDTGQSARGLLEFFEILGDQELLSSKRQDPYYRSHPLTRERIDTVASFIERSPNSNKPETPDFVVRHARMKAKLQAFIEPATLTLRRYKKDDTSLESRYARAIAYYRKADLDKAIPLIDGLIADYPADPYFQELKGQILFENGHIGESIPYHENAVMMAPGSYLLRIGLAKALMENGDPEQLERAIANLHIAANADKLDPSIWWLLGTAYGKAGNMGKSSLALGEAALLTGKPADARFHAERAASLLKEGTVGWMQAQDILHALDNKKEQ
ncbi:MAG: tetratricopeptide repeat protein, partial [Rhodospirillales bacterium]|nr:tetratricopeptide repeat protein [Rhodospirillales bacterium]